MVHIDPQLLKDIQSNPYTILEKLTIKEIAGLLKQANHAYHEEGKPLFTDDIYEIIRDYLSKLVPDHPLIQTDIVGAVPKKDKVKLPIWMGSLNKIKDAPELIEKWKLKYKDEYIVSDKLDGISCLFKLSEGKISLFSRGNGEYGQNISHLLQFIKGIPVGLKTKGTDDILIRGELILSKEDWESIKAKRTNPRNTVAGLANSKKPDANIAKLVWFIAYECIEPRNLKPYDALKWLEKKGFRVVYNRLIIDVKLNSDELSKILLDRRKNSLFEIDGLVVFHNKNHIQNDNENPSYAFAFKSVLTAEKAEVIVKDVKWNVSKNGLLKPVVHFDMVFIGGAHIQKASGHNGQMIFKNNIGPGSRIIVIRSGDVIPYILDILTPSASGKPSLPDQIYFPWKWNDNKVEIVLLNPLAAKEYHLKQLENYINVVGIKGLGSKLTKNLFNKGIDSVKKLVNITKMDLYKATYSATITMKIYSQMQDIYRKGSCVEFMQASNIFGGGFGKRKFKLIAEAFPQVLENNPPTLSAMLETKGIGERFARHFLENLGTFHEFMNEVGLPCRSSILHVEPTPDGLMVLSGKTIVFTGFRSKELEKFIVKRGGKVNTSVSSSTHIVVAKNLEDDSIKGETAKELGIPIMSLKIFSEETGYIEAPSFLLENNEGEFEAMKAELEAEGIFEENDDNDELEEENKIGLNNTAECVRHAMNWANMKRTHIFGKSTFDSDTITSDISQDSPKLQALLKKINLLDQKDFDKHGHHFKHMIFSDVTKRGFGAKIIASGLISNGFIHAYDKNFILDTKKLSKTKGNNFAILASTQIFTKPINVEFKKKLLDMFNSRPKNVYGDNIRIMLLDSGYKEGIDLFDIKYVHLYEPLLTYADETQAIGRATRFCGQKGLDFDDKFGWKLNVYKYDHIVKNPELIKEFGGENSLEIILAQQNKNKNLMKLAYEIEKACQNAAVDKYLTHSIHSFVHNAPPINRSGGAKPKNISINFNNHEMDEYIKNKYKNLKWPPVYIENLCNKPQKNTELLEFSPSQNFIREYFQPTNPYKGMFLWHSIGSGKTCTAVGAASYSWETDGYTILWVTRGTLRSDVYKNMFDMSCLERIRDYIKDGNELPENMVNRKKLLSKSWLPPISYRQFNNVLHRQNRLYDFLIKRNGYSDPFKKTLLIIDEVHLMMSSSLKEKEKPDIELLKSWIRNSYKISGENSVRVLLMSATPITDNAFNFIPLINLTSETDITEDDDKFTNEYLDKSTLEFTTKGLNKFKEAIVGRISYLNRTKDIRQFTQPVIHNINVPISKPADLSSFINEIADFENALSESKEIKLGDVKKELINEIEKIYNIPIADCDKLLKVIEKKTCVSQLKKEIKVEKEKADEKARLKVQDAKIKIIKIKENIKIKKKDMKEAKKNDGSIMTVLNKKCFKKKKEIEENSP